MNLRSALVYGKEKLQTAGVLEAENDAWLLLSHVTGVSRAAYFMEPEKELANEQEEQYTAYIARRCERIPVQHLTGEQEFMGLTFAVNPHVLVPRQDTEVLVETVLEQLQPEMTVLDMCTGSGCILVSLMKFGSKISGTGADVSEKALDVAEKNARSHEVQATFVRGDLFENVEGTFDIIVSNPPYIPTKTIEELEAEVKLHDPFAALDGKEDGLYFYREIIKKAPQFLKKNGRLYFEIGHDQGRAVTELMEATGFTDVIVKKDLAGLDRVVFGVYNI